MQWIFERVNNKSGETHVMQDSRFGMRDPGRAELSSEK
jgi:hypothetical protein